MHSATTINYRTLTPASHNEVLRTAREHGNKANACRKALISVAVGGLCASIGNLAIAGAFRLVDGLSSTAPTPQRRKHVIETGVVALAAFAMLSHKFKSIDQRSAYFAILGAATVVAGLAAILALTSAEQS